MDTVLTKADEAYQQAVMALLPAEMRQVGAGVPASYLLLIHPDLLAPEHIWARILQAAIKESVRQRGFISRHREPKWASVTFYQQHVAELTRLRNEASPMRMIRRLQPLPERMFNTAQYSALISQIRSFGQVTLQETISAMTLGLRLIYAYPTADDLEAREILSGFTADELRYMMLLFQLLGGLSSEV